MESRLDHFDILDLYVFACVFLQIPLQKVSEREGDVVSCLVWIHSDSDSLGFCSISHCCNVMGCESQGQFAQRMCFLLFFVYLFCIFMCLCFYMFALRSHFASLSLCVCLCVRALVFVCG